MKTNPNDVQKLVLDLLQKQRMEELETDEEYAKEQTQERYLEFKDLMSKIQHLIPTQIDIAKDPMLVLEQLAFLCYHEGYTKGYSDSINDNVD